MGTEKRERQKANREAKLAAEAAAEAKRRRIRFIRNAVILTVGIIIVGFLLSLTGCSKSDSEGSASRYTDSKGGDASTTTAPDASTSSGAVEYGTGACAPSGGTPEPVLTFSDAPKKCIDPSKTYTATFKTSEGDVTLELDTDRTPLTTNNFVNLARSGYFDGTKIFRTEAASGIIQGGSPHTQDNSDSGPGYTIPDESLPFTSADYKPGTIAMARTAQANSASGQFFFLANEGGKYLGDQAQLGESAGTYVVFGQTTEGLDVLQAISDLEDPANPGTPSKPVTIESVTITES